MNLRLYIITFCLLFAGLALHGQAPEKRFVGNCRFSGFALLADSSYRGDIINDSSYRGDIINFTDRMGDGYNLTQLAVGYEIFDGRGLVFEIDTIHESTNFTADVSVTARVDRGFAPFGSGQVYNPTENGLIPPSSQEQAGLSPTQKARIDRHNVVVMESLIGDRDTVYSITNLSDTSSLSPALGYAFINATADTLGLYNGAYWVLFCGGGDGAVSDTARFFVYAPAHGLEDSISAYGYVPVKADFTKANSSTLDSTHFAYAVGAPHVDTLELKLSGPLAVTAHGLIVGRLYYLQDDGTEAVTPGTVRAPTVYVLDVNTVVLTEVGADQDQVISRQAVPSPVFTFWGGDPQNPSDSIMQIVVDSVFAPAGLAKPSTIFFMSYSSQSKNPTYQDDSPTDSPLNPSHSWFYDGNVVTRMNHLLTSVDLQATSAGLFTLDTVMLVGGIPTDSTVANWLDTNYVQNNLRLPNGAILYWKGDGTAQSPQYKWVVRL